MSKSFYDLHWNDPILMAWQLKDNKNNPKQQEQQ